MYFMKRSHRRKLFNVFAFALLAFAIYLTVFHKEDSVGRIRQAPHTASIGAIPGAGTH